MKIPEIKKPAQIKYLMPDRLVLSMLIVLRFHCNSAELVGIKVVEQFIEII